EAEGERGGTRQQPRDAQEATARALAQGGVAASVASSLEHDGDEGLDEGGDGAERPQRRQAEEELEERRRAAEASGAEVERQEVPPRGPGGHDRRAEEHARVRREQGAEQGGR